MSNDAVCDLGNPTFATPAHPQLIGAFRLGCFSFIVSLTSFGCTVQKSDLLTALALDPDVVLEPLDPDVVAAIDERPIGGASLTTGTVGGGDYATAFAAHHIYRVSDLETLRKRVSGSAPAIVLIEAGDYTSSVSPMVQSSCLQACDPTTPIATQTVSSGTCAEGQTSGKTEFDFDRLKIGSNKTLIGLGKGAYFTNIEFSVTWSTSVILRNLSIADVSPTFIGVGYGLRIEPADHIWLDHISFTNIGKSYVLLSSDYDETTQEVLTESGYVTFSNNHFDGFVEGICGQRCRSVMGSNRNPALTFARNWFQRSNNHNPYLFGPRTWGHLLNNLWSDIDGMGVAMSCGATGILQGNVFNTTTTAIYDSDSGAGSWSFCATGLFGTLYAPMGTDDDEDNLLDSSSATALNGQTTDGTGLTVPLRKSGNQWTVEVPVGPNTESYSYELMTSPDEVTTFVKANAGVGKLFQ